MRYSTVSNCPNITNINFLKNLTKLQCNGTCNIDNDGFINCTNLEIIKMKNNTKITNLNHLTNLKRILNLNNIQNIIYYCSTWP